MLLSEYVVSVSQASARLLGLKFIKETSKQKQFFGKYYLLIFELVTGSGEISSMIFKAFPS